MMKFISALVPLLALALPTASFGQVKGNLENPSNGGYYSGIQVISGWICEADTVELLINGTQYVTPAYGTDRLDTRETCGDIDNGFGLLVNFSNLGSGEHEAVLFADGQEVDRTTFTVTALSTGEFATGLEGCVGVSDFPSEGRDLELAWSESTQNFQIKSESQGEQGVRLEGLWSNDLNNLYFWSSRNDHTGGCSDDITLYVTGFLSVTSSSPEKIDLIGSGRDGVFEMKSTGWDTIQREIRFELKSDKSMIMRTTVCPGMPACEKTPQGSIIELFKVLDPFDSGYLAPVNR